MIPEVKSPSSGRFSKLTWQNDTPTAPSTPSIHKSTRSWTLFPAKVKGESNDTKPHFNEKLLKHAWKWGSDWGRSVQFIFTAAKTPNGVHAIPAQAAPGMDTATPRSPQRWQTKRDGKARVAAHKVGRSEQSGRREDQLSICLSSSNDGVPQR